MFAKLSALVSGGPALNYKVEEAYATSWGPWTHHSGTSNEDGSPVSIFRIEVKDPADLKLVAARNGVKRLRMLRHPNVLSFKDSVELQERGATVIYLVTEPVKPLSLVLEELGLTGQHRDEYLAMGLLHMASAVSFINNDCKMIHGHLCMAAVVVTTSLDWKLHGCDLLSEHGALTGDFALQHASWMVPPQYLPAEVARREWGAVAQSPPWAVDAWGLGCMMQEVFSGRALGAVEGLRNTQVLPPALLGDYQKLLSSQPARRLNPSKVAESSFLNNKLVEVVAFMENVAVKEGADKDAFFKRLPRQLPSIPDAVAQRKLLPLLVRALEFGGAPPSAVGSLLSIGRAMGDEQFTAQVVPVLGKLFASPDRGVRRCLLEAMDSYAHLLTQPVIEGSIYPPLSAGFSDDNAYIRELTLKALLVLAPKMKQATLTQGVLKHLSRLQVDPEPSIRANTTVLLGNLAQYLGETYCKKVLLNAFGRALKDPFPPARGAALRALSATLPHYSAEEVATRALPAVAPLAVDPLPEVHGPALACVDAFTRLLRDHAVKLDAAAAAAAEGGTAGAGAAADGGGSMLGWAMSSLGVAAKPPPAAAPAPAVAVAAAPAAAAAAPVRPAPAPAPLANGGRAASGVADARGGGADGWDDDDDDGLLGLDPEEEEARARLARLAGPSKPSTSAPAAAAAPPPRGASSGHILPPAQSGWDDDLADSAGGGWESGGGGGGAAVSTRPRPQAARPRPLGATTAPARPRPAGGMKLGATKLGAAKKLEDEEW